MKTYLHEKFYINAQRFNQMDVFHSVTVAISGGQDSLCLMKLIQDFKEDHHPLLKIHYVYIDHQWRQDSIHQVQHLLNIISSMQETVYIYQINHVSNSEVNARKHRYQILVNHSISLSSNIIITAHTQTDKIETFWQQIIRGATINGITSLNSERILENNIQIWRPLINFTRDEIHWFCRRFCLPIWYDKTNYLYDISRNRLRNELTPYLRNYFQQNFDQQIDKFIRASNIDNEYIKQSTVKLYLISRHENSIAINYYLIKQQHLTLQVRVLQLFIYHSLNQILNQYTIYQLICMINHKLTNKKTTKLNNMNIAVYRRWLYFY